MASREVTTNLENASGSRFVEPLTPIIKRPGRNTNQLEFLRKFVIKIMCNIDNSLYFQNTNKPMDLSIINERLQNNYYWTSEQAIKDFNTMFTNCYVNNPSEADVTKMAKALQNKFSQLLEDMPENEVEIENSINESATEELKQKLPKDLKVCADILKVLLSKEASIYAWPFLEPIAAEFYGLNDYRDIIKNPMDLGTVKTKLEHLHYKNVSEFAADVRLMFKNCYKYFDPKHDIIIMGKELEKLFNIQMNNLPAEIEIGDAESNGNKDEEISSSSDSSDDIEELLKQHVRFVELYDKVVKLEKDDLVETELNDEKKLLKTSLKQLSIAGDKVQSAIDEINKLIAEEDDDENEEDDDENENDEDDDNYGGGEEELNDGDEDEDDEEIDLEDDYYEDMEEDDDDDEIEEDDNDTEIEDTDDENNRYD